MLGHRIAQRRQPRLQVGGKKSLLLREVGHRRVVTGNKVAHHLEQAGNMVFAFGDGVAAREAQPGQVGAQLRQRLVVEKAAQVVRAEQVDLGLADPAEQRVVFGRDLRV